MVIRILNLDVVRRQQRGIHCPVDIWRGFGEQFLQRVNHGREECGDVLRFGGVVIDGKQARQRGVADSAGATLLVLLQVRRV